SAWLSDKIGRKPVMVGAAIVMALAAVPLFGALTPGAAPFTIMLVQMCFAFLVGIYAGPVPALLVEMFPTNVRFSGMAITYNVSAALFGGTSPMVCEWLVNKFGGAEAVGLYVIASCLASLIAFIFVRDRFREAI